MATVQTQTETKKARGQAVRDWLSVLIVPVLVAIIAGAFAVWQNHASDVQHDHDTALALDSQRSTSLDSYFDHMQDLMQRGLLDTQLGDDRRAMARGWTLSMLPALNPARQLEIWDYLREANLLVPLGDDRGTIISFYGADLTKSIPPDADLRGDDLNGAILTGADLHTDRLGFADLSGADLTGANLSGANLTGTDLRGATLKGANLNGAQLGGAHLEQLPEDSQGHHCTPVGLAKAHQQGIDIFVHTAPTNLEGVRLSNAQLQGGTWAWVDPSDLHWAYRHWVQLGLGAWNTPNLLGADLSQADVSKGDLSQANLNGANLTEANLTNANLSKGDLSHANLTGAVVTNNQLASVQSLQGAQLPDGSIHP